MSLRKLIPVFIVLTAFLFPHLSSAQQEDYAYRISFKNKNISDSIFKHPEHYLSSQSLARRQKYNIPIDTTDFPVYAPYINSVLFYTQGRLQQTSKWMNTALILLKDTQKVQLVKALPFVKKTEWVAFYPTGYYRPQENPELPPIPNNNDSAYYGAAWNNIHLCNGENLHWNGFQGDGTLIALIDAGFVGVNTATAFDSLRNSGRILDRWNFVQNKTSTPNEGAHGTQVLSCISGFIKDEYVGTAPNASVALYTSEDLNSEQPIEHDNWVAAAERADSIGADIITTSLGYNTYDPPFADELYSNLDGKTTFIAQGVNMAVRKGIFVTSSIGNEGLNPWKYLLTPGDADSAFTVGGINQQKLSHPTSSYGPNAAGRIKPDVAALGAGTAVVSSSGTIDFTNGTSFATPIITGLAACLLQSNYGMPPYRLKHIIRAASSNYHTPDDRIGYGIPNFYKALQQSLKIEEQPPALIANIYPNPTNMQSVFLKLAEKLDTPVYLSITDMMGRTILEKTIQVSDRYKIKLDLPTVPSGTYFIKINYKNTTSAKPFVVY